MPTKKQSDLLVITKTRNLANYVFTVTHKSPKEYRFSIVSRMQNYVLDAVENLYRANAVQLTPQTIMNREHYQREAMTAYRLLGTVAQIGSEQGAITAHQMEQIAMQVSDCEHLLGAWVNSDRKRLSK